MVNTDWERLYQAAILELNPDKLLGRIDAAEHAIAEQEGSGEISPSELRRLWDARVMLRTLRKVNLPGKDLVA